MKRLISRIGKESSGGGASFAVAMGMVALFGQGCGGGPKISSDDSGPLHQEKSPVVEVVVTYPGVAAKYLGPQGLYVSTRVLDANRVEIVKRLGNDDGAESQRTTIEGDAAKKTIAAIQQWPDAVAEDASKLSPDCMYPVSIRAVYQSGSVVNRLVCRSQAPIAAWSSQVTSLAFNGLRKVYDSNSSGRAVASEPVKQANPVSAPQEAPKHGSEKH